MKKKCPYCGCEIEIFVYPDINYLNNVRVEILKVGKKKEAQP